MKNCPICKKKLLLRAIKNHILNKAEGEAYKKLMQLLYYAKNKPYQFSPAVMLRQMPHFGFVKRNTRNKIKFELS